MSVPYESRSTQPPNRWCTASDDELAKFMLSYQKALAVYDQTRSPENRVLAQSIVSEYGPALAEMLARDRERLAAQSAA